MKHLFVCISMLFCLCTIAYAGNDVPMTYQPNGSIHGGNPKSPACQWYIFQSENVLTMHATPCDYTLCLYDEDGNLTYTVFVPEGTTQVVLPTALFGDFEIIFESNNYYYYGYISL